MALTASFCGCCSTRTGVQIIASLSLVAAFAGTIYFGAMSAMLWNLFYRLPGVQEAEYWYWTGDWVYGTFYYSMRKWHNGIFSMFVTLAILHSLAFIAAGILVIGIRLGNATLMLPWLLLEVLKTLLSAGLGVTAVLMAPRWARRFADFIAAMSSGFVDFLEISLTEDFLRVQFTAAGVCLVASAFVSCYFVIVVFSHSSAERNKNGKSGAAHVETSRRRNDRAPNCGENSDDGESKGKNGDMV